MIKAVAAGLAVAALAAGCGQRTPATSKLETRSASVGIMALRSPRTVPAASDFTVRLAIRNTGGVTLPSLGATSDGALRVQVSYHWKTTDHAVVVWDGLLTPLDKDLPPGATQELDVKVRPPPRPGLYILEFDVLQTTAFWFGGIGSQTASMLVEVR